MHSRSLEPRWTAAYNLLSINHVHGPISYRFRDKRRFLSKIAIFSHPPHSQTKEFPLSFCICNGGNSEKLLSHSMWKEFKDRIMHWFMMQYQTLADRRTDIQICYYNISRSVCAMIKLNSGSF